MKNYEKPFIKVITPEILTKYGSQLKSQNIKKEISGISVKELTNKYGSPLFVFSEKEITEKYNTLKNAFKSRYDKVVFSWSYKTNYLNEICKIYHKLGSIAEVVSEFEYDKARKLGIEGKNIIFNGPYKTKQALLKAVKEGAKIHIDNWYEINDLEEIAKELNIEIPVAIRCNMDTGIYPQWSRFGFNIDNGEAYDAIKRIFEGKKLILNGLHAHIGTFMLTAKAYGMEVTKMIQLKNKISEDFGFKIEYIDIGGGFASKNRLKGIYQSPEVIVPTPDDYAEEITNAIYNNNKGELPTLYLETGRHLIDEAGYLLTTVFATKRLANGLKSYIVDAGVNLLYTYFWYNFNIGLDKKYECPSELSQINGPLCMNIDVIADNIELPIELDRGSVLTVYPVGAYNVTQSMQFIQYRPRIILIDKENNTHIIRESDDLNYVQEKECNIES